MNASKPVRVRTLTVGLSLTSDLADDTNFDRVESAVAVLKRGQKAFAAAGHEVQTLRIAINPVLAGQTAGERERSLGPLERLDALATASGVMVGIGPVIEADRDDVDVAPWATELVRRTRSLYFSAVVASQDGGTHSDGALAAARIMTSLSQAVPDGMGNFRFAAAANIPAGTPFFPVAWHAGPQSLAMGVESASLVEEVFASAPRQRAGAELVAALHEVLIPLERTGAEWAAREQRIWRGIDTSPAPLQDRSIAAAIEALTHMPFGSVSTLEACSIITSAVRSLNVTRCGYCGLMLPVLEDPVLAQRAGEGRYGIRDLLLYSSVCGTGLDVVPIPGDTSVDTLHGLLKDVAALSVRLSKPLSARLLLVPGRKAGEMARFNDPLLTDCVVMKVD